jgi:hypothetical protein
MKYIFLLIALMKIMVLSRKRLSRRSKRTRGEFHLIISVVDLKMEHLHQTIYDGLVEILPFNEEQAEIKLLVKAGSMGTTQMENFKVKGTNIPKEKLPFFKIKQTNGLIEGYEITVNRALGGKGKYYLRYGLGYILASFSQSKEKGSEILLDDKGFETYRLSYFNNLEKDIAKGEQENGAFFIKEGDVKIQEKDYGIKKQELAIMDAIKKGYSYFYYMGNLFERRTGTSSRTIINSDFLKFYFDGVEKNGYNEKVADIEDIEEQMMQKVDETPTNKFDDIVNTEKAEVILRIKKFAAECEKKLKLTKNEENSQKSFENFGESILKEFLAELGISEKSYEYYDPLVEEFFNSYLNFYITQFVKDIQIENKKILEYTLKHIKAHLHIYGFRKQYKEVKQLTDIIREINSGIDYYSFDSEFNEKNMLFLRYQFMKNEEQFFRIMSLIQSHIWIYSPVQAQLDQAKLSQFQHQPPKRYL